MEFTCKICGNKEGNKFYTVREMQFGTRDEFVYCQCSSCECLQITNPPENLSKYYPKEYFSFQINKEKYLKEKLNIYRDRYALGINNFIGKFLYKKYGEPTYVGWLKNTEVNLNSKILDVGCGFGKLLFRMGNTGFKNLTGIDAFIERDIFYKNGVKIYKRNLSEIRDNYDLIMMHHSLEHLEDQHAVFKKLSSMLESGKHLLIRIPICSSFAWKTYKENWFALEAPRHLFNHSLKSLNILADKYEFEVVKTTYDSRSIQFWGSEQYKKDIPLMDERSYFVNPDKSIFTSEEMNEFENRTKQLNKDGEGDQAGFFLKRK
ncbi:MAG: class I SAM-dependent methyltransferase [Bacteroidetes bacterium]|nr:class I SAM-dependent methyltransferase [Bacteroidota bacterium]